MEFYKILIPALIAVIGWIASHQFTAWRDRENKRREFRLNFLIDTFRSLSKASHHPRLYEIAEEVERAVSDIQYLGTNKQIEAAQKFATKMYEDQSADLDPILNELQKEIRKELGREPYTGKRIWLKISEKKGAEPDASGQRR